MPGISALHTSPESPYAQSQSPGPSTPKNSASPPSLRDMLCPPLKDGELDMSLFALPEARKSIINQASGEYLSVVRERLRHIEIELESAVRVVDLPYAESAKSCTGTLVKQLYELWAELDKPQPDTEQLDKLLMKMEADANAAAYLCRAHPSHTPPQDEARVAAVASFIRVAEMTKVVTPDMIQGAVPTGPILPRPTAEAVCDRQEFYLQKMHSRHEGGHLLDLDGLAIEVEFVLGKRHAQDIAEATKNPGFLPCFDKALDGQGGRLAGLHMTAHDDMQLVTPGLNQLAKLELLKLTLEDECEGGEKFHEINLGSLAPAERSEPDLPLVIEINCAKTVKGVLFLPPRLNCVVRPSEEGEVPAFSVEHGRSSYVLGSKPPSAELPATGPAHPD